MSEKMRIEQVVARNVKAEAARYDLSNEDLEKILGKSKTALHARLVGDVEFRTSELSALANAMGIDVIDFFAGTSRKLAHQ
ncbi:hypothetical protein E4U03_00535 [Rothia nasimurium]|uniref:HTH cro/C1-type domain-containing protein n=1 Tax=Rothia nasimurium TaxID=85336 RepID=A0A4Y9F7U2_9MICC|nr:hypothetical protein [Rothia nasimurium]MBF0807111.1 hypothetical protein [Rothia nasimurium]TFU24429.1 hypothetical protein E4U03_00535 [Rothia nasimurium]